MDKVGGLYHLIVCVVTDSHGNNRSGRISLLNGAANLDELSMQTNGYSGVTLRLLNADCGEWSLYRISSRNPFIDNLMVGGFSDGVGSFYADDTYEGHAI